ncbi:MAG TPA: ABC transporter ATP-binding protein/permease [Candidatus Gallimonas intestinigallinarum]|uniref:ABC transporter ATP-binding protein/permease n=1 Tax=Candidatus Gallimonas intestinigallinarum TaxID=2838604 RepID=A0A9D2IVU9_9FIRM|nr:ABC transporter ATP-binding protein/permease [Candidatus Gallimonas intestinigallinarum]
MKHLFSCLKAYRKEAILAPLFKLCEAVMELLVPLVVAQIMDIGIAGGDVGYILTRCLILVAFGVAGLAFALTAQFFAAKAAVGASAELRARLFDKLQSMSYTSIDEMGTATMITRMTSDVNQVQSGVNMTLRLLLRSPLIVFGAMIMAFTVDWAAALVFVAVIPLLALAVIGIMALCIPLYKKVQGKMDGVYLATRENLAGVRVVRAFCKEKDEVEQFEARNAALRKEQKRAGRIAAITNPLTYALVNIAAIALVWVGATRVDGGILLQGDVVALYSYLSIILVELVKLANLIFTVSKAISCEKRIEAVLEREGEPATLAPEAQEKEVSDAPAFSFEDVTFAYHGGGAPALHNITFSARRGETVGILGGTGSGKSTLVNLLPRFYPASRGAVKLDGVNVNAIPAEVLRTRVGVVPQKAVLFKGTIRSNLLWGNGGATDEQLARAVRLAQAEDVVRAKGGLDAPIEQEGKNLSGGQRQRLTIARALVRDPEVLILDDSSSALDYATDARLREALRGLDCTVLIVSQRTASVRHADKIVVLDDGGIAGIGTHEQLMGSCALYREIAASQAKEALQ